MHSGSFDFESPERPRWPVQPGGETVHHCSSTGALSQDAGMSNVRSLCFFDANRLFHREAVFWFCPCLSFITLSGKAGGLGTKGQGTSANSIAKEVVVSSSQMKLAQLDPIRALF